MKTIELPSTLLLCLCVACAHTRTAASPRQEERAAEKAENEPSEGETRGSDSAGDGERAEEKQRDERSATGDPKAQSNEAGDGKPAHADGDRTKAERKGADEDDENVTPEDIEVATTPQGLLEPDAMDKVRDKLGVAKGESVQASLRRFQREQGLPATGMLDHETVERLGLSPDEIFER